MENQDESLFWGEFDRLLVFLKAIQISFFDIAFLKRMCYQTGDRTIGIKILLDWAKDKGLLKPDSMLAPNLEKSGQSKRGNKIILTGLALTEEKALLRWRKRHSRRNKRDGSPPMELFPFEQITTIGIDDETKQVIQPMIGQVLNQLSPHATVFIEGLQRLNHERCIVWNNGTKTILPANLQRPEDDIRWFMATLIDLSIITPIMTDWKSGNTLWGVIRGRLQEIVEALEDPSVIPKGDALGKSSIFDVLYCSFSGVDHIFYQTKSVGEDEKVQDNGDDEAEVETLEKSKPKEIRTRHWIGPYNYRKVLHWLDEKDNFDKDQMHIFPTHIPEVYDYILEELVDAGLLSVLGKDKRYSVNSLLVKEVLEAIRNPGKIPRLLGSNLSWLAQDHNAKPRTPAPKKETEMMTYRERLKLLVKKLEGVISGQLTPIDYEMRSALQHDTPQQTMDWLRKHSKEGDFRFFKKGDVPERNTHIQWLKDIEAKPQAGVGGEALGDTPPAQPDQAPRAQEGLFVPQNLSQMMTAMSNLLDRTTKEAEMQARKRFMDTTTAGISALLSGFTPDEVSQILEQLVHTNTNRPEN